MSLSSLNQIPVPELPKTNLVARFIAAGGIVLGIAGSFLYVGGWLTPKRLLDRMVV